MRLAERAQAGVVVVNGGTRLGAAHGLRRRQAVGYRLARGGTEALDVYSDLKVVNVIADPEKA